MENPAEHSGLIYCHAWLEYGPFSTLIGPYFYPLSMVEALDRAISIYKHPAEHFCTIGKGVLGYDWTLF